MKHFEIASESGWFAPMKCLPSLVVLGAMMGWLVSFAAMAQSDGLVAYWPLDELRAGATPDVVGDYDLKATHLDVSDVVAGRHGRAIAFESGRQTLLSRVHEVGEELPINQHPSFTLSLWVKVDGRRQNDLRLFSEGNTVDSNPLFNLGTHSGGADGRLDVYLRQSGWPTFGHSYSEYEPLDGQWHHLAWVEYDGQRSLYVDGRLDALEIAPRP
ncbi:MAG: LamG-like jellyroll fold domain-containing protein, partial [Limisphaerales bacterium]